MDLARLDRQVDALEDLLAVDRGVQVLDFEHALSSFLVLIRVARGSTDAAFEADAEQFLRLDGELHRQLLQHFLAEAVDDQRDRVLG